MLPIIFHPDYVIPLPSAHRFPMSKYGAVYRYLREIGLATDVNIFQPDPAPVWWLELAHDSAYVDGILTGQVAPAVMRRIGLPWSAELALRGRLSSAGTVLTAEQALQNGIACNCAGGSHHAGFDHGAGFCVFNDVAVAARVLQATGQAMQFLVIDLDVHQGDGTAAIFRGDNSVFTFSVHAASNFPARKQQSDLDIALPDGVDDDAYLDVIERNLPDLLDHVRPDLVFYIAGVDPHLNDRLGALHLTDAGLARREQRVLQLCRDRNLSVAGVLGGGYDQDIPALARRHAHLFRAAAAFISEK